MVIIKRIIRFLNTLITYCVIGIAFVMVILFVIGIKPYAVTTGSMQPVLPVGSLCFVNTKANYEGIIENDIIAFQVSGGLMVTHRAIKIENGSIITKGDANNTEDAALVTKENYIGKTIFHIPWIGFLMIKMKRISGIVIFICLLIVHIIIEKLVADNKDSENKSEDRRSE